LKHGNLWQKKQAAMSAMNLKLRQLTACHNGKTASCAIKTKQYLRLTAKRQAAMSAINLKHGNLWQKKAGCYSCHKFEATATYGMP